MLTLAIILLSTQALAFEFCDDGTAGENNIRLISVNDMLKENSKEWIWQSYQKIELEARVENKNDEEGTYILEAVFKDEEKTVRIATDSSDLEKEFSLSGNERKSISLEFEVEEDLDADSHELYIKFYKKNNEDEECVENSEIEIEIEKIEICDTDEVDSDELELTKIYDEIGDNENKWEWAPGDNIEISLFIENKDYSEREFTVELIFLDENNEEVLLADDSDDIIKETNLDEDEKEDLNFEFKLKSEIEVGKYTLYAKAYDSEDSDICTSLKAEEKSNPITIQVKKPKRKVIVTGVEGPENAAASSSVQYTATITNLGAKTEEKVLAIAYNYQLGIRETVTLNNLESGGEETATFNLEIPENASLSRHAILFSTEYEYNEKQDHYKSSSREDDDIKHYLTVSEKIEEPIIEETLEETNTSEEANMTEELLETTAPQTIITGNAVGTEKGFSRWVIIIILLVLIASGITFFLKKSNTKEPIIHHPNVTRRYKARLN